MSSAVSDEYVCALVNEIDYRLKNNLPDKIHTVYIGGGTPSLLKPSCILRICDAVKPFMEKDFQYELEVLCGENYINCNYASARIQNIKPLVWDDNFHYYVVPE